MVYLVRAFPGFRLLLLGAVLVFTAGCGASEPISNHIGQEPKERIADLAAQAAQIRALSDKAVFLSRLAVEWAVFDRKKAEAVLDQALTLTRRTEDREAVLAAVRIKTAAWAWPPADKIEALIWAERIIDRAWSIEAWLAVAAAWLSLEGDQAKHRAHEVLVQALGLARTITDPVAKGLAFRAIAALMVEVDSRSAEVLAGQIKVPELKAWAFHSLAERLKGVDKKAATGYYASAFQAGSRTKDPVSLMHGLVKSAAACSLLDPEAGQWMFREAVKMVSRIKDQGAACYAYGLIGAAWGSIEYRKAFEVAAIIPGDFPEARFELFIKAAAGESIVDSQRRNLLEAARREALRLSSAYEKGKALGRVAVMLAAVDWERALEVTSEIESAALFIRDEALELVAAAAAAKDLKKGAELIEGITSLYLRTRALTSAAVTAFDRDKDAGRVLLDSALELALAQKEDSLLSGLALVLASFSDERALAVAGSIGRGSQKSLTLAQVAREFIHRGRPDLGEKAWAQAMDAARSLGSKAGMVRAAALKDMAGVWAEISPDKAAEVYELAYRAAVG